MTRCKRCGDPFEPREPNQRRCLRCAVEVAAIVAADEKRRAPRFGIPKDLTTLTGLVL